MKEKLLLLKKYYGFVLKNKAFSESLLTFLKKVSSDSLIDLTLLSNNLDTLEIIANSKNTIFGSEYDISSNKMYFANSSRYDKAIYHELFHCASTKTIGYINYSGFKMFDTKTTEIKGVGINEGYTELLHQRFFGANSAYLVEKLFASKMEEIIDPNDIKKDYFTADLDGLVENLSKYSELDEINKFIYNLDIYNYSTGPKGKYYNFSYQQIQDAITFCSDFMTKTYINKLLAENENDLRNKIELFVRDFEKSSESNNFDKAFDLSISKGLMKQLSEEYNIDILDDSNIGLGDEKMQEQLSMTYEGKTINITRFTINNSNNEDIKLPYVLVVPENISENSKLIVACSTPKSSPRKYDEEIEHLEKDKKENVYAQTPNYVKKLMSEGYPVLFPIIPRFRGYYSTFLSSQVKNNDTSELIEWIDKDPEHYTHLEKDNIDRLKDIDKQVYAMIGDSKKILENYTNIDDKVIMTGYSAGAHFSNGFTALHPDIVDMEICGGQAGLQIQPFTELNGEKLNYPLGFNDIGGNKLEQYKQVSHFFYMGSEDVNDPAQIDVKDGEQKAHFSSNYTDKEVKQINKIYKGIDQQSRFEVNKMICEDLGMDTTFKKYQGNHQTVQINDDVSNDVLNWVKSKTISHEIVNEKPKVLVKSNNNNSLNGNNTSNSGNSKGFADALLLALITGFVDGIITTIMINIIV